MGNSNVSTIYNCYYLDGDIKDDNAIALGINEIMTPEEFIKKYIN